MQTTTQKNLPEQPPRTESTDYVKSTGASLLAHELGHYIFNLRNVNKDNVDLQKLKEIQKDESLPEKYERRILQK